MGAAPLVRGRRGRAASLWRGRQGGDEERAAGEEATAALAMQLNPPEALFPSPPALPIPGLFSREVGGGGGRQETRLEEDPKQQLQRGIYSDQDSSLAANNNNRIKVSPSVGRREEVVKESKVGILRCDLRGRPKVLLPWNFERVRPRRLHLKTSGTDK